MNDQPQIAILMATCNGAPYLREQLDSIMDQSRQNWVLTVSDDGSTDETRAIIRDYGVRLGERLRLVEGPRKGFQAFALQVDFCFHLKRHDGVPCIKQKIVRHFTVLDRMYTPQVNCTINQQLFRTKP